jgi:hypothetical protein
MNAHIIKKILIFILTIFFCSCITEPKEGIYKNYTYEKIIKKHGNPKYDYIYDIDKNFELDFIEPNYALYFTQEELENGVQVRRLVWENIFNYRKIIWLKNTNGQWTAFDSLEYNSKFIVF